jgi:poly(3-hydroxybutyrate) depolymerase
MFGLDRIVNLSLATQTFLFGTQDQLAVTSSGCGTRSPWKFDSTHHSNRTIGDRSFYVHIPPSYNPNVPHAIVLSFHGFKEDDVKQEKISGFSAPGLKINDRGIIAVYPMGAYGPGKDGHSLERAWEGAPYAKPGVDDIAFTRRIIDELNANLCVDDKRIYAAGKSNGGGFTNLLACTPSTASLIAAFAPVSPALYPGTLPINGCDPGRVVPVIAIHGLADPIIPFNGKNDANPAYDLPPIPTYRKAWATRDGCAPSSEPTVSHPHASTTVKEWDCSDEDSRAVVKGYTVDGLGHSWPTTNGLDGGKASFNATPDDIVPFFEAHPFD